MRTTTSDPAATVVGSLSATAQPERVATTTELVRVRCLDIADFAESLSARLLSETSRDGQGPDDEYLRGYARAMQDLSEALRTEGSFPCLVDCA